ncbi:hypothetical protein LEP1GSC098_1185 [Leptospira interrogans serovar Grippotyphosa str. UI 08434]|nr:hypothetical protein LEP1GSC098_1185 [Leptospira interrogans serovar Grippotyphosa str. UI 08434]
MHTGNIISKSHLVSIYYRTDHKERSTEFPRTDLFRVTPNSRYFYMSKILKQNIRYFII